MRVSNIARYSTVVREIHANQRELDRILIQVATNQRIQKPHEDPVIARRLLYRRTALELNAQYQRNAADAQTWLETTDTALGQAHDYIIRARELAIQARSDTLDSTQAAAIASEVEELIRALVEVGNATIGGRYLFAGLQTATQPFHLTGSPPSGISYSGDAGAIRYEIAQGVTIQINLPGDPLFTQAVTDLIALRDRILARDLAGIGASLTALDRRQDDFLRERAAVGGKSGAVALALERLRDEEHLLRSQMAADGGVDMAEASVRLAAAEAGHRAALAAASKVVMLSLVDFLR